MFTHMPMCVPSAGGSSLHVRAASRSVLSGFVEAQWGQFVHDRGG